MAVSEVQDTFFHVSEPVRRPEPLPHAEDAKQTSDAGVYHTLGRTTRHSPASGGRCASICSGPVGACWWRGQEEETEEEKVVLLRSRVRDSGRGGLWPCMGAHRSGLSAYTSSCHIVVQSRAAVEIIDYHTTSVNCASLGSLSPDCSGRW